MAAFVTGNIRFVVVPLLLIAGLVQVSVAAGAAGTDRIAGTLESVAGGRRIALPLEHTAVSVEVSSFVARTSVEQRFANPFDEPIEAVYSFPLGDDAAVDHYEIQVGSRIIRGEIRRREEARRIYDEAAAAGLQAALLDQERPNVFTQRVANLAPGHEILVRFQTVQVLQYEGGYFQLTFPLVVAPRYEPADAPETRKAEGRSTAWNRRPRLVAGIRSGHDVSIEVTVDAGVPIVEIGSPSHRVLIDRQGATGARVKLADDDTLPNRDFILRWGVFSTEPQLGLLAHRTGVDGYFTLIVQPRAEVDPEEAAPKEIILVLDTSGSMSGMPLALSRQLAARTLDTLGSRDRFNVVQFASGSKSFAGRSVDNTKQATASAHGWLNRLKDGGGTELLKGLRQALAPEQDPDRVRMIVFLTDGFIGDEDRTLQTILALPDDVRVFTVGIGNSVNHGLLSRMATLGHGAYTFIPDDGDAETAIERLRNWLTRPYLTDLEIDWGALPVEPLASSQPRDLYSGQNLRLLGRYVGGADGEVTVRGRLAGRPWEKTVAVRLPDTDERHAALASVWARQRIDEYEKEAPGQHSEDTRERITELALDHRLLSPFTSFVAVDYSIVTNPDGTARTVEQAVPVPEGVLVERFAVDGIEERVRVVATSNVVDLVSTFSTTMFSDEFVQDLPVPGHFYQNVLAGTQHPSRSRDFTAVVDGVNLDPLGGSFVSLVNSDSVESVESITGGAGVEFGRAQGGFAKIIQKQGSNDFEASVNLALRSHHLDGDGAGAPSSGGFQGEQGGFQLSGPIVKDRLMYRTSHAWSDWDTPVDTLGERQIARSHGSNHDTRLVWQVTPRNKLAFQFTSGRETREAADLTSTVARVTSVSLGQDAETYVLNWVAPYSPKLLFETTLSYRSASWGIGPAEPEALNHCVTQPGSELIHGECYDRATGRFSGAAHRGLRDGGHTLQLRSDIDLWAGSSHQLRFGFAIEDDSVTRGVALAPRLIRNAPRSVGSTLEVTNLHVRIPARDATQMDASGTSWVAYVEDQIKPSSGLAITFGGRLDGQHVSAGVAGDTLRVRGVHLSPLVNVSWDPWSTGKNRFAAVFRRYYENLSTGMLLTGFEPGSVDLIVREDADGLVLAEGTQAAVNRQVVAPGIQSPHKDEWTLGFEREILTETLLRVSWIRARYRDQLGYRNLGREAACDPARPIDAGGEASILPDLTRCPALPLLALEQPLAPSDSRAAWGDVLLIGNHNRFREDSLVVELNRRQYRSWEMQASYKWSRATGSAESFRPLLGDERGMLPPLSGAQSDTRRHALFASAATITPWGFRVGGTLNWLSSLPWSPLTLSTETDSAGVPRAHLLYVDSERNARRGPSYWNVDLKLSKELTMGRGINVSMSLEVFNALNDDTRLVRNDRLGLGRQIDDHLEATRRFGRWYQAGLRLQF